MHLVPRLISDIFSGRSKLNWTFLWSFVVTKIGHSRKVHFPKVSNILGNDWVETVMLKWLRGNISPIKFVYETMPLRQNEKDLNRDWRWVSGVQPLRLLSCMHYSVPMCWGLQDSIQNNIQVRITGTYTCRWGNNQVICSHSSPFKI